MVNVATRNIANPLIHDVYERMQSCQRRGVVRDYSDVRLAVPFCITQDFLLAHPNAHSR